MNISRRVRQLTSDKRRILAHRLKKNIFSQPMDSRKAPSAITLDVSRETTEAASPRMMSYGQLEQTLPMRTSPDKPQQLVAYLVLAENSTLTNTSIDSIDSSKSRQSYGGIIHEQTNNTLLAKLQNFLREHLPDFMIPSAFVVLSQLPRTSTGKVNYQALPNLLVPEERLNRPSHIPVTWTQKQLETIWSSALGLKRIGIHENFFELGGHSLLIAQVVSRIRSTIGIDIPLRSLFDYPTIRELSEVIDTLAWTQKSRTPTYETTVSDREQFEI